MVKNEARQMVGTMENQKKSGWRVGREEGQSRNRLASYRGRRQVGCGCREFAVAEGYAKPKRPHNPVLH